MVNTTAIAIGVLAVAIVAAVLIYIFLAPPSGQSCGASDKVAAAAQASGPCCMCTFGSGRQCIQDAHDAEECADLCSEGNGTNAVWGTSGACTTC